MEITKEHRAATFSESEETAGMGWHASTIELIELWQFSKQQCEIVSTEKYRFLTEIIYIGLIVIYGINSAANALAQSTFIIHLHLRN